MAKAKTNKKVQNKAENEEKMALWKKMLLGIGSGLLAGFALSEHGLSLLPKDVTADLLSWIALPGALFMALIKMIVIPMVVSSVTLAVVSSKDLTRLRKTGLGVGFYFVFTTCVAVILGIFIATAVSPGQYIPKELLVSAEESAKSLGELPIVQTRPSLPDMLVGLFPTNPAQAVVDRSMLQIVIGAILLGIAMLSIGAKKAKPMEDLLQSVQDITMRVVDWAMAIAPFAVFSFLCALTAKMGPDTLVAMAIYVACVLGGLIAILLFYLTLVSVIGQRNPITFLKNIRDAQILAFSSSSSAATMPLTLRTADEKLKLRPEVSHFVVPLGTTINMDGTAIYQIIAALFLTQVFGIELSFMETIILSITIIGASIGSPGSPGVGLVILATILSSIGVTPAGVAMILAVDRVLDMCRTTINVTGDLTASVVMNRLIKPK